MKEMRMLTVTKSCMGPKVVFNQTVTEDRLARPPRPAPPRTPPPTRGAWQARPGRPGMTAGRWDPCCSAAKLYIYIKHLRLLALNKNCVLFNSGTCSVQCVKNVSVLTLQSPLLSPMMAAGSKFKSSRLKSVLISLVKSLLVLSLQNITRCYLSVRNNRGAADPPGLPRALVSLGAGRVGGGGQPGGGGALRTRGRENISSVG